MLKHMPMNVSWWLCIKLPERILHGHRNNANKWNIFFTRYKYVDSGKKKNVHETIKPNIDCENALEPPQ